MDKRLWGSVQTIQRLLFVLQLVQSCLSLWVQTCSQMTLLLALHYGDSRQYNSLNNSSVFLQAHIFSITIAKAYNDRNVVELIYNISTVSVVEHILWVLLLN